MGAQPHAQPRLQGLVGPLKGERAGSLDSWFISSPMEETHRPEYGERTPLSPDFVFINPEAPELLALPNYK